MKKETVTSDKGDVLKSAARIRNVPKGVLDAFDNLVPDDAVGQSKASVVVLKHVESALSSHAGCNIPEGVSYIVRRLVSGLISHRQRVREGYCATLQGLLQLHPSTVTLTYEALLELCSNKKSLSTEEQRNFLTGELLGYGALIRSGHVKNNAKMRQQIIKRMLLIRQQKPYYDIIVSHFLVHMMEKYTKSVVNQEILDTLMYELSGPLEALTPCQLWLRIVILRKFPESVPEAFLDTLKPKYYHVIAKIIVKTSINMPNVHPCLSETISSLAAATSSKEGSKVVTFWKTALAPYMKEPTTNCLQLLFNGLQLVLLQLKTAAEIRDICNERVIMHLLNVMSLHDKNLSASARGVGSALLQLATSNYEQDDSIQLAIVEVIMEKPGSVRFDQLTGTKLLNQMRFHFTTSNFIKVSKILRDTMEDTSEDVRPGDKTGAALFLGRLVSQPRTNSQELEGWRKEQMLLLMTMALLKPDTPETTTEFQDVFFKCLCSQMSRIKEYKVTLQYLYEEAHKVVLEKKDSEEPLLTASSLVTWENIHTRLAGMQEKGKVSSVAQDVFQVMYTQMALYLLVTTEAKDIIEELNNCYKRAKKENQKSQSDKQGGDVYKSSWVDMVVEMLLAFLLHENSLFRSLAQGVFWLICPLMTPTAINTIVDVLDPAKQNDLINIEDSDEEEEDESEENKEEGDETLDEEEDIDEEEEEEESEEESEGEKDEDEEEDMEDEDIEDEEEELSDEEMDNAMNEEEGLLLKLKKEMLSLSGGMEDGVDMDSVPKDELNSLNEKLGSLVGEYLKHKKKSTLKNKGKERMRADERLIMHFRSRVCDLLELYLKESADMGLVLSLINPLVTVILSIDQDRKRQEELLNRIRNLLGLLGRINKFTSNGEATIEFIVEEFNTFFSSALKMRDEFNPIIRGCYHLFMRCGCQLLGEEMHDPENMLIQSYVSHLREIFTRNNFNLRTHTFTDICLSDCGALWIVAELMKEFGFNTKLKCYWQTQAVQILNKLCRNEALLARIDKKTIYAWQQDLSAKISHIIGPTAPLGSIRGQYLSEMFSLLFIIRKAETSKKLTSGINWEDMGSVLVALRQRLSNKTFKICRGPYNTIINNLGLQKLVVKPQVNAEKRKADSLNMSEELREENQEILNSTTPEKRKKLNGEGGANKQLAKRKNKDKKSKTTNTVDKKSKTTNTVDKKSKTTNTLDKKSKTANTEAKKSTSGQSQKKKKISVPISSS